MGYAKAAEALDQPELGIDREPTRLSDTSWPLQGSDKDSSSPVPSPFRYDSDREAAFSQFYDTTPGTPQSPHPPVPRSRYHVIRYWPWELASFGVAIGLMAATIVILAHYNGQKVPEWPFSINLNTLIALLSTILRASMLVVVAEVIGQLKWHWFDRPRPLHDLQDFDQASRSVLGSMKLLVIARTNILALLCALVIILSLAIGPFTQQAIKTVPCRKEVVSANATVPVAHYVPGTSSYYRIAAGTWDVDVDMKGTMINGLTNPTGNDTAIHATCQTGDCTFQIQDGVTHSSIGMCSTCVETTPLVTFSGDSFGNYTLPNGMWVSPSSGQAFLNVGADNMTWARSLWTPAMAAGAGAAIANVTVLSFTTGTCDNSTGTLTCSKNVTGYGGNMDYVAMTCSLFPCIKNYNAVMAGGILTEKIVSTVPAVRGDSEAVSMVSSNYTALKSPCTVGNHTFDTSSFSGLPPELLRTVVMQGKNITAPAECIYSMPWIYSSALSRYMGGTVFNGYCTYDSKQAGQLWCGDSWWLSPLYADRLATADSISLAMTQFVTALTNKFRTTGTDNVGTLQQQVAIGKVFETTVCTLFDWRWLLLPGFLLAASGALLASMIAKNYSDPDQPVWKSSVLPLLYYGFTHPHQGQRQAWEIDHIEQDSRGLKTRFQNGMDAGFINLSSVSPHVQGDREHMTRTRFLPNQ